jgi:RNA recognition motif-containing protein
LVQKIYVGNLPYEATEAELQKLFGEYGEVLSVSLPTDRESGRPRGFGFIEMAPEAAAKAIAGTNGKNFGGRTLTVNEAKAREAGGRGGGGYGGGGQRGYGGYDNRR